MIDIRPVPLVRGRLLFCLQITPPQFFGGDVRKIRDSKEVLGTTALEKRDLGGCPLPLKPTQTHQSFDDWEEALSGKRFDANLEPMSAWPKVAGQY